MSRQDPVAVQSMGQSMSKWKDPCADHFEIVATNGCYGLVREDESGECWYGIYERHSGLFLTYGSEKYIMKIWRGFQNPLNRPKTVIRTNRSTHTFRIWENENQLKIVKTKWRDIE